MSERAGFRDKAKAGLKKSRAAAVVAIKDFMEPPAVYKERQRQQELQEARTAALARPDFSTLLFNKHYKKWESGDYPKPYFYNPIPLFEAVKSGTPHNPYMQDAWAEKVIDPEISEPELQHKCVEFCESTARAFVWTATKVSKSLALEGVVDEYAMKCAITELIGSEPSDERRTIFKDFQWNTSNYTPDFKQLGVDASALSVPEEKIMAGVELAVGLWVRLADMDAKRPVSGHKFGPPFNHCSFLSLANDSGWTEYSNIETFFREAQWEVPGAADKPKQDLLFESFRDPQFFVNIHETLTANDEPARFLTVIE